MTHHGRITRALLVATTAAALCLPAQMSLAAEGGATADHGDGPASSLVVTPRAIAEHGAPGASLAVACAVVHSAGPCALVSARREVVGPHVAEYTYVIQVGRGAHDRIAVHRVVGEDRAQHAAHANLSTFFVHGDLWGFDAAFAGAVGVAHREQNVATYLASRGVDVWGIDLRWVLVPANVPDTTFMRDWGFASQLQDMRLAMTFQRVLRGSSGDGFGRTALVGWSRGAELAYAYAAQETQLPVWARNMGALVSADGLIHYGPRYQTFSASLCDAYTAGKAQLAAGDSAVSLAAYVRYGQLAITRPNQPAPDYPPYTNRVLAMDIGTYPDNESFSPWYHFLGGRLLPDRTPTALRYTPESRWFHLLTQTAPFESLASLVDGSGLFCGRVDLPFDDDLAKVTVPVFELGAAGGFGTSADYSTTLVGSHDVTRLIVRLRPKGQEATDFGHVDLWQARNAPALAWSPLLTWLRSR